MKNAFARLRWILLSFLLAVLAGSPSVAFSADAPAPKAEPKPDPNPVAKPSSPANAKLLEQFNQETDLNIKNKLFRTIGETGSLDFLPLFVAKLDDDTPRIRESAGNAFPVYMRNMKDRPEDIQTVAEATVPIFIRHLSGNQSNIALACQDLRHLGPYGKAAVPALRKTLQSASNDFDRSMCMFGLSGIGPDASCAIPDILKFIEHPDCHADMAMALGALGKGNLDAERTLIKLADSNQLAVRHYVAAGLGKISATLDETRTVLQKMAANDSNPTIREFAKQSLQQLPIRAAKPIPKPADDF